MGEEQDASDLSAQLQEIVRLVADIAERKKAATEWLDSKTLSRDFVEQLGQEASDWAFILKTAALTEAVLTDYLRFCFSLIGNAGRKFESGGYRVSKTTVVHANSTLGQKVHLAEVLNVYEPHEIAWMRALNELRNRYVHKIEHVYHSIGQVLSTFPHEDALNIGDALFWSSCSVETRRDLLIKPNGENQEPLAKRNGLCWSKRLPRLLENFLFTTLGAAREGNTAPVFTMEFLDRRMHFINPLEMMMTGLHEAKSAGAKE